MPHAAFYPPPDEAGVGGGVLATPLMSVRQSSHVLLPEQKPVGGGGISFILHTHIPYGV